MKEKYILSISDTHIASGDDREDTTDPKLLKEFINCTLKEKTRLILNGDIGEPFQSDGWEDIIKKYKDIFDSMKKGVNEGIFFPVPGNHDFDFSPVKTIYLPDMNVVATHGDRFESKYHLIIGKPWEKHLISFLGWCEKNIGRDIDVKFEKLIRKIKRAKGGSLDKYYKSLANDLTSQIYRIPICIIGHTHERDHKVAYVKDGKAVAETPENTDFSTPINFETSKDEIHVLNDGANVNGKRDYLLLKRFGNTNEYTAMYLDMKDGFGETFYKNKGLLG